jgi:hypothetical protein
VERLGCGERDVAKKVALSAFTLGPLSRDQLVFRHLRQNTSPFLSLAWQRATASLTRRGYLRRNAPSYLKRYDLIPNKFALLGYAWIYTGYFPGLNGKSMS